MLSEVAVGVTWQLMLLHVCNQEEQRHLQTVLSCERASTQHLHQLWLLRLLISKQSEGGLPEGCRVHRFERARVLWSETYMAGEQAVTDTGPDVQGTNAHAVLSCGHMSPAISLNVSHLWRHQRYWHSPAPHPALHRAILPSASSQAAIFQTMLGRPELSFLGQHQVLSQRILPAMALAEVTTAAGAMLREDASEGVLGTFGCVWGTRLSLGGSCTAANVGAGVPMGCLSCLAAHKSCSVGG